MLSFLHKAAHVTAAYNRTIREQEEQISVQMQLAFLQYLRSQFRATLIIPGLHCNTDILKRVSILTPYPAQEELLFAFIYWLISVLEKNQQKPRRK